MRVKEFRLRPDKRHMQNGLAVRAGDHVWLTESQAQAWRDKFEQVNDSAFVEKDEIPAYQQSDVSKTAEAKAPTNDAPQGQPVPQPPITVAEVKTTEAPNDPTTLDPDKQGQQSREQRDIVDGKTTAAAQATTTTAAPAKPVTTAPAGTVPAGTAPAGSTPAATPAKPATATPAATTPASTPDKK